MMKSSETMNTSKKERPVDADFKRFYEKSTYKGHGRKVLHTWTSAGFQAVLGYRVTRWLMLKRIPLLGALIQRLVEVWTGVSIPPEAVIGPGLYIPHAACIVVNYGVEIGEQCTLHHEVTLGNKVPGGPSPKIGDRVMIGVGAKVLGGITVGDDVEIGANAVVVNSLTDRSVAVGIPAKVVKIK